MSLKNNHENCQADKPLLLEQIQANPTAFISYGVGYVQMANLKKDAQEELQDIFNDKDFHESILKSGSALFRVVETDVQEYIEHAK